MALRRIRIGIVAGIALFLFVFFVPVLPFTSAVNCTLPAGSEIPSSCFIAGGAYNSGYHSIGYQLTGWGATGSSGWWSEGYSPPMIADGPCDGGSCYLTSVGALLTVVLPLFVASSVLLAPEMIRLSRLTRTGFAALGASSVALTILILASMLQQMRLDADLALTGIFLGPVGLFMVEYAVTFRKTRPAPPMAFGQKY
jgi:uncharacterized membrane protein